MLSSVATIFAIYLALAANAEETIVNVETEWDTLEEVCIVLMYFGLSVYVQSYKHILCIKIMSTNLFLVCSVLFCSVYSNNNQITTITLNCVCDMYVHYRFSWADTKMCSRSTQPVRVRC